MGKKNRRIACTFNNSFSGVQTVASLINKDSITNNVQDVAQEKASYYHEKVKVKNTEKSTKSWTMNFEEFCAKADYFVFLTEFNNVFQLQKQIVKYISTIKKKYDSEYKASSVKQAVDALNRYLLYHSSIPHINLHDKYMFPNLYNILHGKLRNLQEHEFDIQFYLSKRSPSADKNFYLQPNPYWITGSWYRTAYVRKNRLNKFMQNISCETQIDIPIELLSNHSGCKTATQILQNQEVPEQAIMQLTGHKSIQEVWTYKKINESQQFNTLNTLIDIMDNKLYSEQNNINNNINNNHSISKKNPFRKFLQIQFLIIVTFQIFLFISKNNILRCYIFNNYYI
ncbi:hypothetical protein C1645_815905 [Glomus cerebriforme]|uniref:Tyr recombinase domain-containing protein n=1 Tax=Glomus cerebriforme TaxID=658196 RepID=A0A397TM16_9GLOM|nr:hypothetical protein C1645_815905 [Glomus cerebriforme]